MSQAVVENVKMRGINHRARSVVLTLRLGSGQAPSKIAKGEAASFVVAQEWDSPCRSDRAL
jgi:hypothetical protein